MNKYVALLRGINVGGKNSIRMSELKACFEGEGFKDVTTYIQSGNVIFSAPKSMEKQLISKIEQALEKRFKYDATVMVRSQKQLQLIVKRMPKGFGANQDLYRYDVIFLRQGVSVSKTLALVPTRPGVDQAHPGPDTLYFSRLIKKASQSRLSRIAGMPIYQDMTIRNWNTTTALLELMTATNNRKK